LNLRVVVLEGVLPLLMERLVGLAAVLEVTPPLLLAQQALETYPLPLLAKEIMEVLHH
jgi:hypothetical protein